MTDSPTDAEFYSSDINSDELLNVLDVILIVQMILNLLPDICYLEPDSGECDAAFPMYYFNSQYQQCDIFSWGGCNGVVLFESLEECQDTCE